MDDQPNFETRLAQALDSYARSEHSSDFDLVKGVKPRQRDLKPAAVLIPLQNAKNGWEVLLTKRSSELQHHPGQIAFPGGKVDPMDQDAQAAALREAEEEIGLNRDHPRIIGTLPNHETVTAFDVVPIVAVAPNDFRPIPEAGEVEEVFSVPLTHLLNAENYFVQWRIWQDQRRHFYVVPYGPYYIWGATARMLRRLAEVWDHATKA